LQITEVLRMLTALILGFTAGFAATPHCLGMCGGFPLYLASESRGSTILRQASFIAGKTFTYAFMGALASAFGAAVLRHPALAHGAPYLKMLLGMLVTAFGLVMLGVRMPGVRIADRVAETGFVHSLIGGLMAIPSPAGAGILGLTVGFLPCPLPMGMLAVAAAVHRIPYGIALMTGVGLGTAPSLAAVGLCGAGLKQRFPSLGMKAAGVVVLIVGLLMLGRALFAAHDPMPCCK
jgi:sulfite exporter TauE/SafE